MESDLSNYQETPLPYWTEEAFEVPTGLRAHVFSAGYTLGDAWLILPDDGMDAPRHREYALRCNGLGLDICMVSHADGGSSRTHVNLSDVTSIEIFSALLYCELVIHRKAADPLRIPYNGVATTAMRQLLAPLFNTVFIRTSEKLRGARVNGSRANATLREWCGEPGTSCESVTTKDAECAVGVTADRLLLTRPATVTTANNTLVAGRVLHLVPFNQVGKAVASSSAEQGGVTIVFANNLKFEACFEDAEQTCNVLAALQTAMADPAMTNTPAPVTAAPATADARAELLRLIGVELSDEEAQEALDQIHRFKWIAAEKAGFDTWAVIQPGNPLRAAAVHWVRKHFSDFRAGQQGKQSVA